jgi:catechol 2,3-dioxygenase-like lactoylglutathione lyase family enzyme
MKWTIEVITVPVTDIERAKRFYADQLGFVVDLDTEIGDGSRLVQLTPPGSGCSIHLNSGWHDMAPGSLKGCTIVVKDAQAASEELIARGVHATPVRHFEDGGWVDGPGGVWNSFVFFDDPDGNFWTIQQHPPDRPDAG